MKKISVIVMSFIFIFIFFALQTVWAESLAEKKQWYNELSQMVDNPNVLWLPTSIFLMDAQFLTINQLKNNITKNLLSDPRFNIQSSREFLEQYLRMAVRQSIELSNVSKRLAKETLLPQLAAEIKQLEQNQWESWQEADTRSGEANDFSDFLTELNSPEHLDAVDFLQELEQSASDNREDTYATCPKFNPKSTGCWRAYTNGRTDGDTYTSCCYFGGTGSHIKQELPYLQGEKDGTALHWTHRLGTNTYYFSTRRDWKNGQRHGITELYTWSRQIGGPFLSKVNQYNQGKKSGKSVSYRVSGEHTEIIWLNGVSEKIYYYNKDGSLRLCKKKDHALGRWRNCKTGKLIQ